MIFFFNLGLAIFRRITSIRISLQEIRDAICSDVIVRMSSN